ncbi:MAG: hypothetical protein JO035_04345, partial [Betaproteobacteria bacterium]|nr:hypothetical protein [Betaproteobacteria bacterium]
MLKLFGAGKAAHPLADAKEARRVLGELPQDPHEALAELAHWHESVAAAEGFRADARLQALFAVDDAAQPRLRKLSRDYVAAARPSRFQENRIWTAVYGYWQLAASAYARAVDALRQDAKSAEGVRAQLPLLAVRALRAAGQQAKWLYLRYAPVDAAIWRALNGAYAFAEERSVAQSRCAVYPAVQEESTPRLEYVRAVVLNASSPDSLLPTEIELAERLIGELAPAIDLAPNAMPGVSHWMDLSQAAPPQRLARQPSLGAGVRFLSAARAAAELERMIQRAEASGQLPAAMAGAMEGEAAVDLLRHLLLYWSPVPPERRHPRHHVKSRLSIVHGFEGVLAALQGAAADKQGAENWIVENVSAGGFGAVVPQAKGDWLKIGALLAMQPDGGNNWVIGIVRRVSKSSGSEARVGIETLSRAPEVLRFSIHGTEQPAVLLPSPGAATGETAIALKTGAFVPGLNLEAARAGGNYLYLPQTL